MIQIDLPDGPATPLVRGLAACLSSVVEVPLAELPELEDLPVAHAIASWKSWLAGRDFGMVPIADSRSFQWAGWWIAVVDHSDSPLADGPQQQVAVLAFGTPPGIVLSPKTRPCSDAPPSTCPSARPTPLPRSTPRFPQPPKVPA